MSETVEKRTVAQLIARGDMLPGETFVTHGNSIVLAMSEAGILDAHIYGVCQTCGGRRRKRYHLEGSGKPVDEPCPDCKTISVVTTEVRERAKAAYCKMNGCVCWTPSGCSTSGAPCTDADVVADAVLEAVLGDVRVAKDVLELRGTALGDEFDLVSNRGAKLMHLTHGDTIAILED